MKKISSIAALAFLFACTSTHHTDDQPVVGDGTHEGNTNAGGGSGGSPAVCPLGAAAFTDVLAPNAGDMLSASVAVGAGGQAFVAGSGIYVVSAAGEARAALGFGDFVATDAEGNLFIAGSFSSRIDFGNNVVLNPMGNVDVFLAKVDAKGKLVFAKALNLCGDGISALAVAKDGRVAVSGTAMGTVVLDANGDAVFAVDVAGKVAFDSVGELVVAGSVAGTDMFVAMFDAGGNQVFDHTFTASTSFVGGVAVDATDHIAIVGWTGGTIDLFGVQIVAHDGAEVGRVSGAFLLEIDRFGSLVMAKDIAMVEANGVVFDANGNLFIAGANTSAQAFDRLINFSRIDVRGIETYIAPPSGPNGRGLAVAVDACGGVFLAFVQQAPGGAEAPIALVVEKISL